MTTRIHNYFHAISNVRYLAFEQLFPYPLLVEFFLSRRQVFLFLLFEYEDAIAIAAPFLRASEFLWDYIKGEWRVDDEL